MKSIFKSICSIVFVTVFCVSTVYAGDSFSGTFDVDSKLFSYRYETGKEKGYLNIRIYPSDFEESGADSIWQNDVVLKTDDINNDGVFSGNIVIPKRFANGRYIVHASSGDGSLQKIIVNADKNKLSELAGSAIDLDEAGIYNLLKDNNDCFDNTDEIFNTYGNDIAHYVCSNLSEEPDAETFLNLRMQGEAVSLIKQDDMAFSIALQLYENFLEQDIDLTRYNDLSDEEKAKADELIAEAEIGDGSTFAVLNDTILTAKAACAGNSAALKEILMIDPSLYGLDMEKYNGLGNSYYQNNVFNLMMVSAGRWTCTKDIAKAFQSAVMEQEKNLEQGGGKPSSIGAAGDNDDAFQTTPGDVLPTQPQSSFTDISGHWAEEAVNELYRLGVISGYADNTFLPEATITRAEFTVMIVRLFGMGSGVQEAFNDIDVNDWYYIPVSIAAGNGWVKGVTEKEFEPKRPISREDAASILYRVLKNTLKETSDEISFSDSQDISDYAADAVGAMSAAGILNGDNGAFYPKRNITRAEAAALFDTVIELGLVEPQISRQPNKAAGMLYYAQKLLEYIGALPEPSGNGVTKIEFIKEVCQLFKVYKGGDYEYTFKDVTAQTDGAEAVYTALANGWISEGETFSPYQNITTAEAVKIIVCAASYDFHAENYYGGEYPEAYIKTAQKYEIDEGAEINNIYGELSWDSAVMLMYNAVNTYCTTPLNGYNLDSDETWLQMLYGIYSTTGIVNRTQTASLDSTAYINGEDIIEINGDRFYCSEQTPDILGKKCTVFYSEDNYQKEAVLIIPNGNAEIEFDAMYFNSFGATEIQYTDNLQQRKKRLRIEPDAVLIYNGRAVGLYEEYFKNADGTIRVLDNDDDGKYEIIFINDYRYAEVESVSPTGITIGLSDSSRYIDIMSDDVIFNITNSLNEKLTPYDIKKGDVVEVCESEDMMLISMRICTESVKGTVLYTDSAENIACIDGQEYLVASALPQDEWLMLSPGNMVTAVVGSTGKIINVKVIGEEFYYGYMLRCFLEEAEEEIGIKLIDISANTVTLNVAEKVVADGESMDRAEFREYLTSCAGTEKQMVRYCVDENNEIKKIDFPEECSDLRMFEYQPENDKLTKYRFDADTFLYRSASNSCMPYFNLAGTMIFKVPTDPADAEYSVVGESSSVLIDNTSYNLAVYDLNEAGTPAVAVLEFDPSTDKPNWKDKSYIVEKVVEEINNEGEATRKVVCWSDGNYYDLYLPYNVEVSKDNGEELSGGDIFRAKLKNDGSTIMSICVDVYLENGRGIGNTSLDAVFNGKNENIVYQLGNIFKISDKFAYMSTETDIFGDYDYTFNSLKNVSVNTSNIVKYDTDTGEVIPILLDEIKTYSAYGDDCSFVVLRQSRFTPESLFVYE